MTQKKAFWSNEIVNIISSLHSKLVLKDDNWHKLKNNKSWRAAELLASALCQIVNEGKDSDIEALIEQSLRWIREEVKDPGCPSKKVP